MPGGVRASKRLQWSELLEENGWSGTVHVLLLSVLPA